MEAKADSVGRSLSFRWRQSEHIKRVRSLNFILVRVKYEQPQQNRYCSSVCISYC